MSPYGRATTKMGSMSMSCACKKSMMSHVKKKNVKTTEQGKISNVV